MIRLSRPIAVCLLLAGAVVAQDVVTAPSVAKRDQPIKINHPAGAQVQAIYAQVTEGVVVWSFLADEHFQRAEAYTIFAAPPGDYLITTGDSTILKIVQQDGPSPRPTPDPVPPKPDPTPDPEPSPTPKMEIAWAVWIYEQADAVDQIEQTNTRQSIETRRFLASKGIKAAAYDDDQDAAKAAPFRTVAGKLPALLLIQDERNMKSFAAPKSFAELQKLIEEVSGE